MAQSKGDVGLLLAEAQISEKTGDWIDAFGKRHEAVAALLQQPEITPTPRAQDPTNDLETLGEKHLPSKRFHYYLRHYWRHFRDLRYSARKVVEIGVQTPRSVNMWEEFFPNAEIIGLDIDPICTEFAGGRKKIFIGDQMNEAFLMKVIAETGGDFDVVIDDGLHSTYSMLKSFSYLYPAMQPHGVYVIEDIQRKPEMIGFFRTLMDAVNYVPEGFDLRDQDCLNNFSADTPWIVKNTVGVAFYRYIAFIERGFNPGNNRFLMTPEKFYGIMNEYRAEVMVGVEALKREGVAINRENLVAKVGRRLANHVDRYLLDRSRGLTQ